MGNKNIIPKTNLAEIFYKLAQISREAKSKKSPEERAEYMNENIGDFMFFTYLDIRLRDVLVNEVSSLVKAFYEAGQLDRALQEANEGFDVINKTWGKNFSVSPDRITQLQDLKNEIEEKQRAGVDLLSRDLQNLQEQLDELNRQLGAL